MIAQDKHGSTFTCAIHKVANVAWCAGEKARAAAQVAARLHVVSRRADALEAALLWFDAHHPGTLDSSVLRKVRAKYVQQSQAHVRTCSNRAAAVIAIMTALRLRRLAEVPRRCVSSNMLR
jgi:hypothetical protein